MGNSFSSSEYDDVYYQKRQLMHKFITSVLFKHPDNFTENVSNYSNFVKENYGEIHGTSENYYFSMIEQPVGVINYLLEMKQKHFNYIHQENLLKNLKKLYSFPMTTYLKYVYNLMYKKQFDLNFILDIFREYDTTPIRDQIIDIMTYYNTKFNQTNIFQYNARYEYIFHTRLNLLIQANLQLIINYDSDLNETDPKIQNFYMSQNYDYFKSHFDINAKTPISVNKINSYPYLIVYFHQLRLSSENKIKFTQYFIISLYTNQYNISIVNIITNKYINLFTDNSKYIIIAKYLMKSKERNYRYERHEIIKFLLNTFNNKKIINKLYNIYNDDISANAKKLLEEKLY